MTEFVDPFNIAQKAKEVNTFLAKKSPELPSQDGDQFNEEFQFYAWGRLGRKLIEDHVDRARETLSPSASFMYLDGCSSTPWLREVMRGQYSQSSIKRAAQVVNAFETDLKKRTDTTPYSHMPQDQINAIRGTALRKGTISRKLIDAIVYQAIFSPDDYGIDVNSPMSFFDYFYDNFDSRPSNIYLEEIENGEKRGEKGSWVSMVQERVGSSLKDTLQSLPLLEEEVDQLLRVMSGHFANQLSGNVRPTKFVSMDLTDVETFKKHAKRNFPESILGTHFFNNVLEPKHHMVGDIRDLGEFGDKTVGAYSVIEGFPFYKTHFSYDDGLQIVSEAARVLVDGGKFIIFPWTAQNPARAAREKIKFLEEYMAMVGFRVEIDQKDKEKLLKGMNQRELDLVANSPIFHEAGSTLPLLVATKETT